MCQAIAKPKIATITRKTLRDAWDSNPDGAGFAYVADNGLVTVEKGYFTFKSLWRAVQRHQHRDLLVHLRWATHGAKTVDNCHPFIVGDSALVHNGILTKFTPLKSEDKSDTRIFIEEWLLPSLKNVGVNVYDFFTQDHSKEQMEKVIGYNKLAVLTPQGFAFAREYMGEWVNGVWWSAGDPSEDKYAGLMGSSHNALYKPYAPIEYASTWERDMWSAYDETEPNSMYAEKTDFCEQCGDDANTSCWIGAMPLCERCWTSVITTP